MPGIKTSIYDGSVALHRDGSDVSLDLSTATATHEVVAITVLGTASGAAGTQLELTPVTTRWTGNLAPDGTGFAATAETDFGADSGGVGTELDDLALPAGVTIEGRWKKVTNKTANSTVICYLKAKPIGQ
tara:strand:+ start:96 stop:485 length:390 start_codon:yes stop_codon:yes gene_type:complete